MNRIRRIFPWLVIVLAVVSASCTTYQGQEHAASAYAELGNLSMSRDDYSGAVENYKAALQFCGECRDVSLRLGLAYIYSENYSAAAALLEDLLLNDPDNLYVLDLLALNAYRRGDVGKALDRYLGLISAYPAYDAVRENIIQLAMESGKHDLVREQIQYLDSVGALTSSVYIAMGDLNKIDTEAAGLKDGDFREIDAGNPVNIYWTYYLEALEIEPENSIAIDRILAVAVEGGDEISESLFRELKSRSIVNKLIYLQLALLIDEDDLSLVKECLDVAAVQGLGFSDLDEAELADVSPEVVDYIINLLVWQ